MGYARAAMEDLLQESFIEIFRSLPHYRGESLLQTWADRVGGEIGAEALRDALATMRAVSESA